MNEVKKLDGATFKKIVYAGAVNLKKHVEEINDLNVFPIPDGDTGDNMLLTILGGSTESEENECLGTISRKIADGILLAARGNSGVILSQLFDGMAEGLQGIEEASTEDMKKAFGLAVKHAYNAVMVPTEGTMLTVARESVECLSDKTFETHNELFEAMLVKAKETLERTPDMLPVLKKAGVVDSGGAGIICIIEGMKSTLDGVDCNEVLGTETSVAAPQDINPDLFTEDDVLEFGYCTEILLRLQTCKTNPETFDVNIITDYLTGIGDSVATFKTGSIVKVHVHTKTPDKVLAFCQNYGEFLKIKIENMSLQHNSVEAAEEEKTEKKTYGIVAVCNGEGIADMFLERGTDVLVDGGQSMNPSTEDFLEAFKKANAETIFVFPNNSNIILAAKQAAEIFSESDVRVIESKTIGDGLSALSMFDPDCDDPDMIVSDFTDAMEDVVTASVSLSIRDTESDGLEIKSGDYIGFIGKTILTAEKERIDSACKLIDRADIKYKEICIIIYGKEVPEAEAKLVEKYITENYPGKEVYLRAGMQEIYDYMIILE